jgi:DNA-binding HxlR family transcriptional regulator
MDKIKYKNRDSLCACKVSLDILGDKWSLIIVRDLFRNKNTFSQFLKESSEGIASNILIDRLKKLIELNIIGFERNSDDKKVKKYYLTDRGVDLYSIIYELQDWTIKNVDFNHSANTEKWEELNTLKSKDFVISSYKNEYKKLRLEEFGF